MSSTKFVADLRPDPGMRRLLGVTALVGLAAGLWVLFSLPIDDRLRCLAASGWVTVLAYDWQRLRAAQRKLVRFSVYADGSAALRGPDGTWLTANLSGRSVVLARLAWVELRASGGRRHYELLRGDPRQSKDWRRFQVIVRHLSGGRCGGLGSDS